MRLWINDPETPEGKYPIVLRRDGSVLTTPHFLITMRDPCFEAAMKAYADEAERRSFDPAYVQDIRDLADKAESVRAAMGPGDPDAPRHRQDDPVVLAWARSLRKDG